MANKILAQVPFAGKAAKLTRLFLREGIRRSLKRGFTCFLDFASGLPTKDHIHKNTPVGTKIIYSDIDPITVDYGKEIIGDNPNVKYEICDIRKPETILNSNTVKSFFGNDHKVAIGFNGICWCLADEDISYSMKVLYDWADDEAILFLTDYDSKNINDEVNKLIQLYNSINQYIGIRDREELIELAKPWKVDDPGFLLLEEWTEMSPIVREEMTAAWSGGGLYGGFLKK